MLHVVLHRWKILAWVQDRREGGQNSLKIGVVAARRRGLARLLRR